METARTALEAAAESAAGRLFRVGRSILSWQETGKITRAEHQEIERELLSLFFLCPVLADETRDPILVAELEAIERLADATLQRFWEQRGVQVGEVTNEYRECIGTSIKGNGRYYRILDCEVTPY